MNRLLREGQQLLRLLDTGDCVVMGVLIAMLYYVGRAMIGVRPRLASWGPRCGAAAFALFLGRGLYRQGIDEPYDLIVIVVRAVLAGYLAWAVSWIVLAIGAGGQQVLAEIWSWPRRQLQRLTRPFRFQPKAEFTSRSSPRPDERTEATARLEAARRRSDARFRCELEYNRQATELAVRLSRERFDQLVSQFLGDEALTPADIDQRGEQIVRLMHDLETSAQPAKRFASLADLIQDREAQKDQIRRLGLDPLSTDALLIDIDTQYDDLTRRFVRGH